MAMTAEQLISFFDAQAEAASGEGMQAAELASNYYLGTFNCCESFKCRLMKGLIEWRIGIDPGKTLKVAVTDFEKNWNVVQRLGGDNASLVDCRFDTVRFVAYIVGKKFSFGMKDNGLEADQMLDHVLGEWLYGSWNEALWDEAMDGLNKIGSKLAQKTYALYKQITKADQSELQQLAHEGESLFDNRSTDEFFSGGLQIEGGGEDNKFTIDYRLAALLKRAGYQGDGVHTWKW